MRGTIENIRGAIERPPKGQASAERKSRERRHEHIAEPTAMCVRKPRRDEQSGCRCRPVAERNPTFAPSPPSDQDDDEERDCPQDEPMTLTPQRDGPELFRVKR